MNVFEEIKRLLTVKTKGKEITKETALKDLGLDSLDLLSLVVDAEDHFGVRVDEEALKLVKTVGDVAELFSK